MRYTHVFLDMDGTLLDTGDGVKRSFQYALQKLGRPVLPAAQLDFVLGPPLYWSFHDRLGLPEEEAQRGVDAYREYYQKTGIWQCRVYDGMTQLLLALRAEGVRLGVVTGKPEEFAGRLVEYFGLRSLFDFVVGTAKDDRSEGKKHLLERAFASAGLTQPQRRGVLMVGDRCYDIDGARQTGIDSMGVLYGFGTRQELTEHGATLLAASADEARTLLCGPQKG